jgi:phospholipase/carboxylesterase
MQQQLVAPLARSDVAYLLPETPARTWYRGRFTAPVAELEPELSAALSAVAAVVARARPAERPVVLVGFSQGGCLVAELLARRGALGLAGAAVQRKMTDDPEHRIDELAVGAVARLLYGAAGTTAT